MNLYQHTDRCESGKYQDCVLEWDIRRIVAIWGLLLFPLVHNPDIAQNLPRLLCYSCSQTAQSCGGFGLCYPCPAPELLSERYHILLSKEKPNKVQFLCPHYFHMGITTTFFSPLFSKGQWKVPLR